MATPSISASSEVTTSCFTAHSTSYECEEDINVAVAHPTSGQATPALPLPSQLSDIHVLDTTPPPTLLPTHNGFHINNIVTTNTIATDTSSHSASALSAQCHVLRFPVNADQDNLSPLSMASTRIPDLQVNSNDPLCHLIDVEEFKGLSLMTKFQPDLKVFVCERCQCGIWADHLMGHIFNKHKSHLPRTLKRVAVAQAVQKAKGRLHPGESSAITLVLPGHSLPPMPWLRPPILGHQCRLCLYVARTIGSIQAHGKKNHPHENCASEHDPQVSVQLMFFRTQYFRVHPVLQNIGPDNVFSKFYAALPTHYVDGSFINGNLVGAPDYSDLSPFLTAAGWVQATESYSMTMIRSMSSCKIHPKEPHATSWSRVKGLGKKYFSSLCSTSNIDGDLLDALTSWRVRR